MSKLLILVLGILLINGELSKEIESEKENSESALNEKTLYWQGRKRTFWVYLPSKITNSGSVPLLFHLHGGGGTAKGTARLTNNRFNQLAERDGFIVVYPNAVDRNWNDGRKEAVKPQNRNIDDVGFITEIVKTLSKSYNINKNRIFTAGMSNGGFMSSRLLCDRADLFRGGAIVTASLSVDYLPLCKPKKPVAVVVLNGTDDPIVPFKGGDIRLFKRGKSRGKTISNDDFLQYWKTKNGCKGQPVIINLTDRKKQDGTSVSITTYTNCQKDGALKFYKIKGGGHTWPGGKQYLSKKLIGNTSYEINACDEIWDFFKALN